MEGVGGRSREYEEGCRLKIKTTLGDDIEGHVLTYDRSTNIVVIHILLQSLWRLGFCAIFGVLVRLGQGFGIRGRRDGERKGGRESEREREEFG